MDFTYGVEIITKLGWVVKVTEGQNYSQAEDLYIQLVNFYSEDYTTVLLVRNDGRVIRGQD
jgi:hypothetical protein